MTKQGSSSARDWREGRRLRAWELKQQGWKQNEIAEALGVSEGAVSQWLKRAAEGGVEALRTRKPPGRPPELTAEQRAQLPEMLARGAKAHGFRGDVWTRARVAKVIEREFGVKHHPVHVGRILRACGWSTQKPAKRARQRKEGEVARWYDERWPEVKKSR
jgi:transposase